MQMFQKFLFYSQLYDYYPDQSLSPKELRSVSFLMEILSKTFCSHFDSEKCFSSGNSVQLQLFCHESILISEVFSAFNCCSILPTDHFRWKCCQNIVLSCIPAPREIFSSENSAQLQLILPSINCYQQIPFCLQLLFISHKSALLNLLRCRYCTLQFALLKLFCWVLSDGSSKLYRSCFAQ